MRLLNLLFLLSFSIQPVWAAPVHEDFQIDISSKEVTLQSKRLILQPLSDKNQGFYEKLLLNQKISQNLSRDSKVPTQAELTKFIEEDKQYWGLSSGKSLPSTFVLIEQPNPKNFKSWLRNPPYVGILGLSPEFNQATNKSNLHVFWAVAPEYQGRGYATEAAHVALKYAQHLQAEDRNIGNLSTWVFADNQPSLHILNKLGFKTTESVKELTVVGERDVYWMERPTQQTIKA